MKREKKCAQAACTLGSGSRPSGWALSTIDCTPCNGTCTHDMADGDKHNPVQKQQQQQQHVDCVPTSIINFTRWLAKWAPQQKHSPLFTCIDRSKCPTSPHSAYLLFRESQRKLFARRVAFQTVHCYSITRPINPEAYNLSCRNQAATKREKGHSSDPTYNSQPSLKHSGVYRTRDASCVTNLHPGVRAPRGGEELQVRPPLQGTKEHRNLRRGIATQKAGATKRFMNEQAEANRNTRDDHAHGRVGTNEIQQESAAEPIPLTAAAAAATTA